ncbi:hypothetical protein OIU76_020724 [Salix suchowensis]|nr:hypothetical protein OIU76_020724 [Salix suchowensis]
MVINSSVGGLAEFKEELPTYQTENDPTASNGKYAVLDVSTSRKALLSDDKLSLGKQNALKAIPGRLNILNFSSNGGLSSPSTKFKQMTEERDEISRSVPSPSTSQGILDAALPKKSQRDAWFEVNNQILNALFTLMCLYQHPKRFYHLYALCSLNLEYNRSERPAIGVGICLSVAIAAPAMAGLYTIISPLGKEYDCEFDEEAQIQTLTNRASHLNCRMSLEKRFSFASRDEQRILDFCVFGWNMERLGFGNMYVHIATFLLFCTAPFWIFNLAAVNIDNETVRVALGLTGIALCLFGLLYGGFWRIQMRKRFNLPARNKQMRVTSPHYPSLPREDGVVQFLSSPNSLHNSHRLLGLGAKRSPSPSRLSRDHYSPGRQLSKVEEDFSMKDTDDFMKPPALALIQREGNAQNILMENNHL